MVEENYASLGSRWEEVEEKGLRSVCSTSYYKQRERHTVYRWCAAPGGDAPAARNVAGTGLKCLAVKHGPSR